MFQQAELVRKLVGKGFNVSPEALEILSSMSDSQLDHLLDLIPDKVVIEAEDVLKLLEGISREPSVETSNLEVVKRKKERPIPSKVDDITILRAPRDLGVAGTPDEFISFVRRRFEFLKSVLIRKSGVDPIPIASLVNSTARNGDNILIIGMIMEKRVLRDFSIRMVLDDETGSIPVIFRKGSRYWERADKVPVDSVLAVKGTYINGRIYADSFKVPDINGELVEPGSAEGKVAMISDTHIGSKYFNEEVFDRFVRWLNSDGASDVRYLIICGDLVDGIGVYPGQEDELKIPDVYRQFELAASFLKKIPSRIRIIYVPGNHEPVRQAEPQPIVPDEYLERLLEVRPDMLALPNPSMIGIRDVKIMIYHGRSLNAIFKHIPGLQPIRPETVVEAMTWILRLRHLTPIYGEHPISPEREDWLLLDVIPHALHTGHIHIYGVGEYKGVKVINSGTFENETPYIKSLGIEVTVGKVPLLNLENLEVEIKEFA